MSWHTRTPRPTRANWTSIVLVLLASTACQPHTAPRSIAPADSLQVNHGYGFEPRQLSTSRLEAVLSEDLGAQQVSQIEELLIARFPGVQVLPTAAGGFLVRIRSFSTLTGDGTPLYVVDGMPLSVSPTRGIDWLNTADVARVDVLKDAASTAIYGVRGANGVILITTKQPK